MRIRLRMMTRKSKIACNAIAISAAAAASARWPAVLVREFLH